MGVEIGRITWQQPCFHVEETLNGFIEVANGHPHTDMAATPSESKAETRTKTHIKNHVAYLILRIDLTLLKIMAQIGIELIREYEIIPVEPALPDGQLHAK